MNPKNCTEKRSTIDDKKVYCKKLERWTNCLEVGHCTLKPMNKEKK